MKHRCHHAPLKYPNCKKVADPAQTITVPATNPQEQDEELHYCTACGPVARNLVEELRAITSDDRLGLSELASKVAVAIAIARTELQLPNRKEQATVQWANRVAGEQPKKPDNNN